MELLGFAIDTIVLAEVMSYGHELGQAVHCEIRDSLVGCMAEERALNSEIPKCKFVPTTSVCRFDGTYPRMPCSRLAGRNIQWL